jgi:hypothetical protein
LAIVTERLQGNDPNQSQEIGLTACEAETRSIHYCMDLKQLFGGDLILLVIKRQDIR